MDIITLLPVWLISADIHNITVLADPDIKYAILLGRPLIHVEQYYRAGLPSPYMKYMILYMIQESTR